MSKLKNLSGMEVVKALERFNFLIVSQKGSHVKLQRVSSDGSKHAVTIPLHNELDKGTLKAIFNQASRHISENELKNEFYTE